MNTHFLKLENYGSLEIKRASYFVKRIEKELSNFVSDANMLDYMKGGTHKDVSLKNYLREFENSFVKFKEAVLNPDSKKTPDDDDLKRGKKAIDEHIARGRKLKNP